MKTFDKKENIRNFEPPLLTVVDARRNNVRTERAQRQIVSECISDVCVLNIRASVRNVS